MDYHQKLCDVYIQLLESIGCKVNDKGVIGTAFVNGSFSAMMHENKCWYLPTREILRDMPADGMIFNPFSEKANISDGEQNETPLRWSLRRTMNVRLNFVLLCTLKMLATINASEKLHVGLVGPQRDLLNIVFDKDSATVLDQILDATDFSDVEKCVINIAYRPRFQLDGQTYLHVGVTSFPLMEELVALEKFVKSKEKGKRPKVFGVSVNNASLSAILELMRYVLPNCDEKPALYSRYSLDTNSPRLFSVLEAYYVVGEQLSALQSIYKEHLGDPARYFFSNEWQHVLDENPRIIAAARSIGMGEGSDASVNKPVPARPAPQPITPVVSETGRRVAALAARPPAAPNHAPPPPVAQPTVRTDAYGRRIATIAASAGEVPVNSAQSRMSMASVRGVGALGGPVPLQRGGWRSVASGSYDC